MDLPEVPQSEVDGSLDYAEVDGSLGYLFGFLAAVDEFNAEVDGIGLQLMVDVENGVMTYEESRDAFLADPVVIEASERLGARLSELDDEFGFSSDDYEDEEDDDVYGD